MALTPSGIDGILRDCDRAAGLETQDLPDKGDGAGNLDGRDAGYFEAGFSAACEAVPLGVPHLSDEEAVAEMGYPGMGAWRMRWLLDRDGFVSRLRFYSEQQVAGAMLGA